MDTFKDKQDLDDMLNEGRTPWQVWRKMRGSGHAAQGSVEDAPFLQALDRAQAVVARPIHSSCVRPAAVYAR